MTSTKKTSKNLIRRVVLLVVAVGNKATNFFDNVLKCNGGLV